MKSSLPVEDRNDPVHTESDTGIAPDSFQGYQGTLKDSTYWQAARSAFFFEFL